MHLIMKVLSFTIAIAFFFSTGTAFGQLKSMTNAQVDTSTQSKTPLTPNMFFDTSPGFDLYSFSATGHKNLSVLDRNASKLFLHFGRSFLANKNDLNSLHTFTPLTVSDYNRQARQQFFMAEPTSQQWRSLPLYNW